jgi:general secretion pathway protein E
MENDCDSPVSSEATGELDRSTREFLVRELQTTIATRAGESDDALLARPAEAISLLTDALRERATDIHIDPQMSGWQVRLRIDGIVMSAAFLPHEIGARLVNQFKAMAKLIPHTPFVPKEGRFSQPIDDHVLDLRVSSAPCLRGEKLSIRILNPYAKPLELHELGLHEEGLLHIHEWLDDICGMLLVTGPTGSGKTTTLYALLQKLKARERNIVTIEDPVEYEIPGINHMQVDEKHGFGFREGVKAMLRLDPDYLMLGEIRDVVSAQAGITAASGGRAVMSTLHSRDAVGAIDVLKNYGLNGKEISAHLMLVVAQRLVRKLCVHCRIEQAPTTEEARWLTLLKRQVPGRVWQARGCERCQGVGYHGRTGVFEVWRIDKDEYQLILNEADRRLFYRQLARRGHKFLLDKALATIEDGITSIAELRGMGGVSALPTVDREGRHSV